MLWMLAKHLLTLRPRFRIQVLSSCPGPLEAVFNQAGIAVTVDRDTVQDARWCAHYMADQDLVVANTIVSWRAVVAAKALEKPCLWWIHESKYGWRQAHFNKSIARAFPLAQKVVFPCEATRRLFEPFSSTGNYIPSLMGWNGGPPRTGRGKFPAVRRIQRLNWCPWAVLSPARDRISYYGPFWGSRERSGSKRNVFWWAVVWINVFVKNC